MTARTKTPTTPEVPGSSKHAPLRVDDVIAQRGNVHGNFGDNAAFHEYALTGMQMHRNGLGWQNLDARQKLALDVIQQKIARILSGDPDFIDHWLDIEGYAKLVRVNLETGEDR